MDCRATHQGNRLLSGGFILGYNKATRPEASQEHLRYPNESTEYRAARNALLNDEIALRAQIETVAAKHRALPPSGKVSEDYVFALLTSPRFLSLTTHFLAHLT
jgi:hypothetical protein